MYESAFEALFLPEIMIRIALRLVSHFMSFTCFSVLIIPSNYLFSLMIKKIKYKMFC